jgi:hypothetical protein
MARLPLDLASGVAINARLAEGAGALSPGRAHMFKIMDPMLR